MRIMKPRNAQNSSTDSLVHVEYRSSPIHCRAYRFVCSTMYSIREVVKRIRNVPSIEHGIGTRGPVGFEKASSCTGDNVESQTMLCELHIVCVCVCVRVCVCVCVCVCVVCVCVSLGVFCVCVWLLAYIFVKRKRESFHAMYIFMFLPQVSYFVFI